MISSIILLTIVPLVLLVVAYFISRALFRIVMAVMTVVFVILIIVGGYIIYDAYRFSDSLESEPNRFVLANETAGVETLNGTALELDAQSLEEDANGTLFIVSESFFSPNATAGYDGINVSLERTLEAIRSSDVHRSYAHALTEDDLMRSVYEDSLRDTYDETQLRSYLFGQLLSTTLEVDGTDTLILGIRDGSVMVEPDRPVLTFIRTMPGAIIEQTLSIEVDR